ncbi:hypothetical protein [Marinoscillum furvescens]|uniref:Uncharacterized protein n=1 Tax=Marinoscillum furvescens DSM 4134 TaxID=1122208 RepID=A0A3D9KYC6_MARFU|nr:hypothetical protein [Marinoscillum furvescens]RED92068.1 hypothetical protein C7460_13337 [Marinoscillum furvescens DSM 4134]
MKKFITLLALYGLDFMQSCLCPDTEFTMTYVTIERARGLFFSFDQHGIYPKLDDFDRTEHGISIMSDSTSERKEIYLLAPTLINSALACQDPDRSEFVAVKHKPLFNC